jgi:hypothetical protein
LIAYRIISLFFTVKIPLFFDKNPLFHSARSKLNVLKEVIDYENEKNNSSYGVGVIESGDIAVDSRGQRASGYTRARSRGRARARTGCS